MALSNWLTRGEWNAAFLAYLCGVDPDDPKAFPYPVDLSTQLRVGICLLQQQGYTEWGGIHVNDPRNPDSVHKAEDSRYGVNACTAEGDNGACLVEIMEGTIDIPARAEETLTWLDQHPELNFPILREICQGIMTPGA